MFKCIKGWDNFFKAISIGQVGVGQISWFNKHIANYQGFRGVNHEILATGNLSGILFKISPFRNAPAHNLELCLEKMSL